MPRPDTINVIDCRKNRLVGEILKIRGVKSARLDQDLYDCWIMTIRYSFWCYCLPGLQGLISRKVYDCVVKSNFVISHYRVLK